ncbi:hypothetical protein [Pseudarthrobacter sp. H2]|uniref:hypothetical protein n=1 Tax=Pseudarthrobacter sp. H2 TaxID=3418415 RepID=UPI003CEB3D57
MTDIGGAAEKDQPKKRKSGCGLFALAVVLLFVVLIVVSCVNNANTPKANPYQFTPSATATAPSVDAATMSKVKSACEAQLKAVAANSGRAIANVAPKPYSIVSVTFTGEVKQVDLPYKEIAWEVPVTWVSKVADGSNLTTSQTCQFRKLQDDARYLP